MEYNFREIEKKWQQYWSQNKTFKVENVSEKPKFYVLDMFPYPSGAGLHVGHPLGYIASDIYSRYKRLNGFNVLHPMGYDAFGLPAEQYAIQTGQHPAITTEKNIARYREQLDKLGFSYDWDREIRTCDPFYYKWTQWTFIQLFNSWYNQQSDKAEPIENLIKEFSQHGNTLVKAACTPVSEFTANEWNAMNEKQQQEILMHYRLAYLADTYVNWCPALGTVLANDEVKEGYSVRGNHPVERKTMRQWLLRITAYAERLLSGLETLEWSDSLKEIQRNWIGRSEGASIRFPIEGTDKEIEVFTTRPDTIFGSTFMVLAPEHELATEIAAPDNKKAVENYIHWAKNRSERERQAEVKKVSGEFTGAYAVNPLNGNKIPVWVAEYVLAGYGTGAIMAVPAHDSRDYAFAKHFSLPIIEVVSGGDISNEAYEAKDGILVNSDFINGMKVKEAISAVIQKVEEMKIGYGTINYRLRDAIFSRQRYWGEPFPVYYKDNIPYVLNENQLPLELPEIDAYQPTETGEPPLARARNWKTPEGYPFECSTMPGFAGSSGYYLRFMDPLNPNEYFSQQANEYWKQVDLYIGGAEHATGHLVYARFWNKFLFDRGYTCLDEPFKKLINQGMIQGRSNFVYRMNFEKYAEYLLWNQISGKKLGVEFFRDFRDGHRKFDFFSPQAKLVIEIKSIKKLEKLVHPYQEYFKEKDYRLMLIPIRSMIDTPELVIEKLKAAIAGEPFEMLTEVEAVDFPPTFVSKNIPGREHYTTALHVDIHLVDNDILDIEAFKKWMPEANNAEFVLEDGKYICGWEIEKMSKSLHNVQNPDELVEKYGADTLRMYEMFLGPLEQSKPWDTKGIEGVFRFIRKFWRLFHNNDNEFDVSESTPSEAELKILHKTIKRVKEDIERFSFNTAVSTFMICTNELGDLKCNKRQVLEPLVILISPYAPHIAEELWSKLGHSTSVANAIFPVADEKYLSENVFEYPVSFNGKMRFKLILPADMPEADIQSAVLSNENAQKWLEGKAPKKVIIVRNKIINVVV